jgi:hypothetical protein
MSGEGKVSRISDRDGSTAVGVPPLRVVAVLLFLLFWVPGGTSEPGVDLPGLLSFGTAPAVVAGTADPDPAGDEAGVLSPAQLARAVAQHRQLPAADRTRLDGLLDLLPGPARGYLLKAFAAGHSLTELTAFAHTIAGRGANWLRTRLRPVDPHEPGLVHFRGYLFRQYDGTSCGSTAIVVAHALTDPIFALRLTTGGDPDADADTGEQFLARLKAEERRVHGTTNLVWPQLLGTPPWGVRDQMNQPAVGVGGRYQWTVVQDWVPGAADAVLRQALLAVARGYPVPVLIGDLIPRHYLLLVGRTGVGALFYEPTKGAIVLVPESDLRHRDFSALGFGHLKGAVLPRW